jgi:Ca2+-binding RTX toxin-like protein
VIFGEEGNDLIKDGLNTVLLPIVAEYNDFFGGPGNDTLKGVGAIDSLYGEAGVDILDGGDNKDNLYGGTEGDSLKGGGGDARTETCWRAATATTS